MYSYVYRSAEPCCEHNTMNKDTSIPMLHMSAMATMVDLLKTVGVPLTPGLQAAHLPTRVVEENDGYVPFRAACTWAGREARNQGIDNLGLRAVLHDGAAAVPGALRDRILSAPTLYLGICRWASMIHRESSHAACWVDDSGRDLQLRFSSTFAQDVSGQSDWIWFATMLHLTVVRLFLGSDWCPKEIVAPYYGSGLETAKALMPDTRFIQDPKITGLTIPRELLSARPLTTATATPSIADLPAPPDSLEASLAEFLRLHLSDDPPRIEGVAEATGFSVRTLQRRLVEKNLSYGQLVSRLRFEQARDLLGRTDMPIHEISSSLGYRNPTHFARAFRRIAGMSPREYRKKSPQ